MRRIQTEALFLLFLLFPGSCLAAASLEAWPEFLRPDPFGAIVAADQGGAQLRSSLYDAHHRVALKGWRGGYASFQLLVKSTAPTAYSLTVVVTDPGHKIQTDLFREWFHFTTADKRYYPDALIPVRGPYSSRLPEPDNKVPQQTAQAFWVDVYIPSEAKSGVFAGKAELNCGSRRVTLPIELRVLEQAVPPEDVVTIDHNSYGSSFLAEQYETAYRKYSGNWYESDQFFHLIHAYHQIFYEHRGIMHQLGYGHSGKVGPEFAPVLTGTGRTRHVADWTLFDRHYGALLDGTAFATSRRGPRPIPFAYLPINPEWPADYEFWGQPGYEAEFVNVLRDMERHFREKGWTRTDFEVFFNQKKRYMGFPWDGDEVRFPKDLNYFLAYGRMMKEALPPDSPVHFRMRADASWDMEQEFKLLKGVVTLWCCGGGELSFYRYAPQMLRERGDVVWYYGGPPTVTENAAAITEFPLRAWLWGVNGFVHWLTVAPGEDPWFHFDGGGTVLAYSGERFGLTEPIPSIRLKIQRNCLQDIAVLDSFKGQKPLELLRNEAAHRFNNSTLDDWWNPRPALADVPSDQWQGSDIDAAMEHTNKSLAHPGVAAWYNVRQYVLQLAGGVK